MRFKENRKSVKLEEEITGKKRIRKELIERGRERIRKEIAERELMEKEMVKSEITGKEAVIIELTEKEVIKNKRKSEIGMEAQVEQKTHSKDKIPHRLQEDKPDEDKPQIFDEETVLQDEGEEEMRELKAWLFKENIRIEMLRKEMQEMQERLEQDKKKFAEDIKSKENSIEMDRKRLEQENRFFDQKMKILQGGFEQLEADKRKFQKERDKFNACKEVYDEKQDIFKHYEVTEVLFRGVNSFLALKKRYRDLIKMFHPDNVAGDHEMVQLINKEYEELKKAYEIGKQA